MAGENRIFGAGLTSLSGARTSLGGAPKTAIVHNVDRNCDPMNRDF